MLITLILVALATLVLYAWKKSRDINKYWEKRGVPHKPPHLLVGNNMNLVLRKQGVVEIHRSIYSMFPNERYYGFYDFIRPILMIKDLTLIEQILIKDFHYFTDRGFTKDDIELEPENVNLFNLNGNKWRATRNKFSPMFTTGKLRHMVPLMQELTESLMKAIQNKTTGIELKDFFQRFTMDVIGSCAFGLSVDAIHEEEESEFRKMGKLAFKVNVVAFFRFLMLQCFPKLAAKLKVAPNNPTAMKYFSKIVKETLAHRKKTGQTRLDFVQLMVTLQEKGFIEFEGDENDDYLKTDGDEKKMERYELTEEAMVGHAFIFLVAGFEATANSLMFLFYDLATNPEVQRRVRKEIADKVKAQGTSLNYDVVKDLEYLNQCVLESTRLHSPIITLFRSCTTKYTIPGTTLTLEPGQAIQIPVDAIHLDPEIFPEPTKYDPNRFGPDAPKQNCSYLTFGEGPRVCIAKRFALTEMKLCAAKLLLDYEVKLNSKTKLPLELDPISFIIVPKNPIYFDLVKNKIE